MLNSFKILEMTAIYSLFIDFMFNPQENCVSTTHGIEQCFEPILLSLTLYSFRSKVYNWLEQFSILFYRINILKFLYRSNKDVELVKVTRSEGVVTRSSTFRKDTRLQRCREYFYGPRGTLMPHSQTSRFHELKFYRIGGGPRAPSSALPIGELLGKIVLLV